MEKLKVNFREYEYNEAISNYKNKQNYFQRVINKLNSNGIKIDQEDLNSIFDDPEKYIIDKLNIDVQVLGNIKLDPKKLIDIIQLPDELIELIKFVNNSNDGKLLDNTENYLKSITNKFYINNLGGVELKESVLKELKETCTIYLTNQKQIEIYNLLNEIVNKVQNIENIAHTSNLPIIFERLLDINSSSISINIDGLKKIN